MVDILPLSDNASAINALTQDARNQAYDRARRTIAGAEPTQEAFTRNTFMRFPPETQRTISTITNIVLAGAFIPSAVRIFIAGASSAQTQVGVVEGPSIVLALIYAAIVGGGSVLIAEAGQIAFTLASSATDNLTQKRSLVFASLLCTAFALIANVAVVRPYDSYGKALPEIVFVWCETLLPPILALIAANVRKTQVLSAIEDRYAANVAFQTAAERWQAVYDSAEQHPRFARALANAMRDALVTANRQSKARLRSLDNADWTNLVERERTAEEWYVAPPTVNAPPAIVERTRTDLPLRLTKNADTLSGTTDRIVEVRSTASGKTSGKPTGELAGAIQENADSTFTYTCPQCGKSDTKETYRAAINALVAHTRHNHK